MEEAERLCDRVAIIEHGRIVDIDTPESLVARHCPDRAVVLRTEDHRAEGIFRALRGVEGVEKQQATLTVRGRGEDFVTGVIHGLSEHGIRVSDFKTISPTLEDVFIKLTGHSIRD